MEQLRPKMGDTLAIILWFLSISLILCSPYVSDNSYNVEGEDYLYTQYKGIMLSIYWDNIVLACGLATY